MSTTPIDLGTTGPARRAIVAGPSGPLSGTPVDHTAGRPPAGEDADEPTADLLTRRVQAHQATAPMLRSLLEG